MIKKDTNSSLENVIGMKLSMHTHTLMHFWYPNNKNEKITNLIYIKSFYKKLFKSFATNLSLEKGNAP